MLKFCCDINAEAEPFCLVLAFVGKCVFAGVLSVDVCIFLDVCMYNICAFVIVYGCFLHLFLEPGQPRTVFPVDSSGKNRHTVKKQTVHNLKIMQGNWTLMLSVVVLLQERSTRTSRCTCAGRSPALVSGCWAGTRQGSLWVRRRVRRLVWRWAWNPVIFSSLTHYTHTVYT